MQRIVLIPPTHEQSTPSFHVETGLTELFVQFLDDKGVHVVQQPVEHLGPVGSHERPIDEIEIEAGTDEGWLEALRREFLADK